MQLHDPTVDTCNELLRGELSAVESYTRALDRFPAAPGDEMLARIRADHEDSAMELRRLVIACGAEPSPTAGVWGALAGAAEGAAAILGFAPACALLLEGEEHGLREYTDALEDSDVSWELKQLIRDELLPRLTDHVIELQRRRDRAS